MFNERFENLISHSENPRFRGVLDLADVDYIKTNPYCGDHIRITIDINNNTVCKIGWDGEGCTLSQAAASILCEAISGKSLDEVKNMSPEFFFSLIGIPLSPNRYRCALLPFEALKTGLSQHESSE
jgi:nitrogen fixation NifU-like protein